MAAHPEPPPPPSMLWKLHALRLLSATDPVYLVSRSELWDIDLGSTMHLLSPLETRWHLDAAWGRGDISFIRAFFSRRALGSAPVYRVSDAHLREEIERRIDRNELIGVSEIIKWPVLSRRPRAPRPHRRQPIHSSVPAAPEPAPPPPRAKPKPAPAAVEPVCEVLSITALCAHKRKVKAGGTLEVVPGKSLGSDKITLDDQIKNPHGDDPKWTLSDGTLEGKSFKATGPTVTKLWIPWVAPQTYVATCSTCGGSSQSLTIHAYPNNELRAEVDFDKILKIVHKLTEWFREILHIVTEKVEFEVMHVKGSFNALWKEAEDWRAFYAYKIWIDGDLLKATIRQMIGPSKIVNIAKKIPGIGKYLGQVIDWLLKAGIYIELSGALRATFKFERTKPEQPRLVKNMGAGLGGVVELVVGVLASVLHDEVIMVKLEAKGGVTFAGEGELGEHGGIEITPKIDFDGLKGEASVRLLRGWITMTEGMTIIEPRLLAKGEPWEIGASEHEGAGGGAAHE